MGDDGAELPVAPHLVVVHLDRLVDLAQRHVDLAQEKVLLVRRVGIELLDQLVLLRPHREVLVDQELVPGREYIQMK